MKPTEIVAFYLLVINVIAFIMMGIDKRRARREQWRIPERTLFLSAIIGGSIGALLGMYTFHHKTRKWYFQFGMPAILILQLVILWFLIHH